MPNYIVAFAATFIIAVLATLLVRRLAIRLNILDRPTTDRKVHKKPTPLLGGLAVYAAFALVILWYAFFTDQLVAGYLVFKNVIGVLLGGLVIMIGGYLDDKYDLRPKTQILFPVLAVLIVIISGVGITSITNPIAGGTIYFDQIEFEVLRFHGIPYFFTVFADLFTFVWLMGMMYTTKYLDGLDGLAGGVSLIAALIIFFVSQHITLQQDYIALFSIIFAGALTGFLVFNFNPASIFLGEGGSIFTGFIIGVLAILSGSKIATALLIFGIPILDVVWVIGRRFFSARKIYLGDKKHLHHRLLLLGVSHRNAVLLMYLLTFLFGVTAIFLQTQYKLYVLAGLGAFMLLFAVGVVYLYDRRHKESVISNQ